MKASIRYPSARWPHADGRELWHRSIVRFDWLVAIAVYLVAFALLVMACVHDLSAERRTHSGANPDVGQNQEAIQERSSGS